MPDATIAACHIASLEHPITALADRPPLSAEDLKAYFDANPIQLMHAHNALVQTLFRYERRGKYRFCQHRRCLRFQCPKCHRTGTAAAVRARFGFDSGRLHHGCQARCFAPAAAGHHCTAANNRRANGRPAEHASGTQFPFMILALSADTAETLKDELASAALGLHYTDGVHGLGKQFGWLCSRKSAKTPSEAFLAKQTYADILSDAATRQEIADLAPVLALIKLSAEGLQAYRTALQGNV